MPRNKNPQFRVHQSVSQIREVITSPEGYRVEIAALMVVRPDGPGLDPSIGPALWDQRHVRVTLEREADGVYAVSYVPRFDLAH